MVDNKGDYDMSAPWGSLDVSKDIFNYDVFGRLLYANVSRIANKMRLPVRMIEVGVASADYMPKGVRAAPLSLVKKNDRSELFAFALNVTSPHSGKTTEQTWYPTVCRARKGLRLYVARYLINSEGAASLDEEETKHNSAVGAAIAGPRAYKLDRIDLGLDKKNTKVCRTVKLVTHLKAAAQKK
ncbi:hypothetical protein BDV59DRAFT_178134 [Aspergillus ambiguus]|uniref:uncharacterized protein n=1 Tax=Aspergillus ambiguus TaxID=176160 RepID=UPI003CCDA8BE